MKNILEILEESNSFVAIAILHLSKSFISLHEADKAMQLAREAFSIANTILLPSHGEITWCKYEYKTV